MEANFPYCLRAWNRVLPVIVPVEQSFISPKLVRSDVQGIVFGLNILQFQSRLAITTKIFYLEEENNNVLCFIVLAIFGKK